MRGFVLSGPAGASRQLGGAAADANYYRVCSLMYVPVLFPAYREARAMTFSYRVDRWTDNGNSILDYVAAVGDLAVARAASACRRWPEVSLRQGMRVMERNWHSCD